MQTAPSALRSPATKYQQVERLLLGDIHARKLSAGERIESEPRLAKALGVSRSTVRHAIENLVQRGVLDSRPGYGHVVRSRQERVTVGIIYFSRQFLPQVAPFHNSVLDNLRQQVEKRRGRALFYFTPDGELNVAKLAADIRRRRFHALVGKGWPREGPLTRRQRTQDQSLLDDLRKHRIAFVPINSQGAAGAVAMDSVAVSRQPTECMLSHGLRRLALVSSPNPDFAAGFTMAHAQAGLKLDLEPGVNSPVACWIDGYSERSGYEQFMAWWKQGHRPEALVITDDIQARGVLTALLQLGVRVPQELRLASLMIRNSQLFYPLPMINVWMDPEDFARQTIDSVFAAMENPRLEPPTLSVAPVLEVPAGYLPLPGAQP